MSVVKPSPKKEKNKKVRSDNLRITNVADYLLIVEDNGSLTLAW
jgi:hypothetical protein